jgi:lipocalin
MSQDTLRVVEKRRHMTTKGNWVKIRKLNGEIQRGIRKDKKNYLKKKCHVLEQHNKEGRIGDQNQQIREITGKPKINAGKIQSRAGIDYIEKGKVIRKWKEYTEELHKDNPNTSIEFQENTYT